MDKFQKLRISKMQQEIKAAQAYGYDKPDYIPMTENFRVTGSTPTPYSQNPKQLDELQVSYTQRSYANGALFGGHEKMPKQDPKGLIHLIEADCEAYKNDFNAAELRPRILRHFQQLAAQTPEYKSIEGLHRRVLTTVFGKDFFENGGGADKQ